jgi:outer membrane murein-binding lipoprotein Lpp
MAAISIRTVLIDQAISAILTMRHSDSSASLINRALSVHTRMLVGYVVVVVVAGVLTALFTYLVWASGNRVQDAIRTDADARILRIKSDSEKATRESNEKIAALNRQAAVLRLEAEAARKDISTAKAEAARANERAANAEKEAARLNKIAEEERLARIKIEERLRPRRLSQEQREALRSALSPLMGTNVRIVTLFSDTEGKQYAQDFADVFSRAGWKVPGGVGAASFGDAIPVGVTVRVYGATSLTNRAAIALQEALRAQGIDAGGALLPGTADFDVELLVGIKP